MGHARAAQPATQGNVARSEPAGATYAQPSLVRLAAHRRRASRSKLRGARSTSFSSKATSRSCRWMPGQVAAVRAFKSSASPTRPTRRSRATWRPSSRRIATWRWTTSSCPPAGPARPDIVLFNGGLFESPVLRQRMIDSLKQMFGGGWQPIVLDNERLDLAVARGAAYYGNGSPRPGRADCRWAGEDVLHWRGEGAGSGETKCRSESGGAESIEQGGTLRESQTDLLPAPRSPLHALCLVPAGVEPGQDVNLSQRRFDLLVSEPVEFPLYVSSTRLTDRPGELVSVDREQMTPLPPIRTVMRTRKKGESETVGVNLHARLTEIGTLDLWCSEIEGKRSWRLQFDVRSATQTDLEAHESAAESEGFVDEATWQECRAAIEQVFGLSGMEKPEGLMKRLMSVTGMNRNAWPTSLCRRIWEALIDAEAGRRKAPFMRPAGSTCSALGFGPATAWRSTIGASLKRGGSCRASLCIPRPPRDWKAGSSGGGSAADFSRGSSKRWPSRSSVRSVVYTDWSSAEKAAAAISAFSPTKRRKSGGC